MSYCGCNCPSCKKECMMPHDADDFIQLLTPPGYMSHRCWNCSNDWLTDKNTGETPQEKAVAREEAISREAPNLSVDDFVNSFNRALVKEQLKVSSLTRPTSHKQLTKPPKKPDTFITDDPPERSFDFED